MPSGLLSVKPDAGWADSCGPHPASDASVSAARPAAARRVACFLRSAATADACGELAGQLGKGVEPGTTVRAGVEQPAHEGRPDDDAVGVARHLGGLVARGHTEPDADREVGHLA